MQNMIIMCMGMVRALTRFEAMLPVVIALFFPELTDGGSVMPKFVVHLQQLLEDEKLQGREGELNLDNFCQVGKVAGVYMYVKHL